MDITADGSPRPSYTARTYSTILTELQSYLSQTRPDLVTDFNSASLGELLLEITAIVGELTSFGLDQAAIAFFLSTATQLSSGYRWAASVGYTPRAAGAATVSMTGYVPTSVYASGGTIPAGSSINGPNGTVFSVLTDVTVPSATTPFTFTMTEGLAESDTFPPSSIPRYYVTTSNIQVAQNSWTVIVGSTTWTQVDDVSLETSATNTYQATFDAAGHLIIQFGDGVAGAIPNNTITVDYTITTGASGNLPSGGVSGTLPINVTGGGTVSAIFTSSSAASGGQDAETLNELKVNIPAFIRNGGKLTTIADYTTAPMRVSGVALSYADLSWASYQGNAVQMTIWASAQVTFTAESSTGQQTNFPYTQYADGTSLISAVKSYTVPKTDVTVLPLIQAGSLGWVDLYFDPVVYDPTYAVSTIQAYINVAIINVFQNNDGLSLRLADLYNATQSVPGVRYATLARLVLQYKGKGVATGTVVFSGGSQPASGDTVVINDGSNTWTFEFTGTSSVDNNHVDIPIGVSAQDTMNLLVQAINLLGLNIVASNANATPPQCNLTQTLGGASLNIAITKTGSVIAVTGMTGGTDSLSTVIQDRRADVNPTTDQWPPGTSYTPGDPWTTNQSLTPATWVDSGQLPYFPLTDVLPTAPNYATDYYNNATVNDSQIIYPTAVANGGSPNSISLRRLWMKFVPSL